MGGRKTSADAPDFWWREAGWEACLLSPLAAVYGFVAGRRMVNAKPPQVTMPVLCIGNFTVGGAGKTPTCIAFANAAKAEGFNPGIVSRGYGGSNKGVHLVDAACDSAQLTGDEPLLLAKHASVAVSSDRLAAAQLLKRHGCDFIIMDDGFQSGRLYSDYALLVVDATRGLGNGRIIPAGPMRAPLMIQMQKASALLRISPDYAGFKDASQEVIHQAACANKPFFEARLVSVAQRLPAGKRYLAFAGIGNPQKFYHSVTELGGEVVVGRSFGDHYNYTAEDVRTLLADARADGLVLATTAKDYVRLLTLKSAVEGDWLDEIDVFDVSLSFGQEKTLQRIIKTTWQSYLERNLTL